MSTLDLFPANTHRRPVKAPSDSWFGERYSLHPRTEDVFALHNAQEGIDILRGEAATRLYYLLLLQEDGMLAHRQHNCFGVTNFVMRNIQLQNGAPGLHGADEITCSLRDAFARFQLPFSVHFETEEKRQGSPIVHNGIIVGLDGYQPLLAHKPMRQSPIVVVPLKRVVKACVHSISNAERTLVFSGRVAEKGKRVSQSCLDELLDTIYW